MRPGVHASRPLVPPALAACLARLPPLPGSWMLARVLNGAMAPRLPADVRQALEGKHLRLRVSDAGLAFDIGWRGAAFAALPAHGAPDLTISAGLHELWLLARREEDPDSLFFARRLKLEGDTELGLLFKNTCDAFDFGALDLFLHWLPARLRPLQPKGEKSSLY